MVVLKCAYELDEKYLAQVCFRSLPTTLLAASAETASGYVTAKEKSLKLLFGTMPYLIPCQYLSSYTFCLKLQELIKNLQLEQSSSLLKLDSCLLYTTGKFLSLSTLIHSIFKSLGKDTCPTDIIRVQVTKRVFLELSFCFSQS